MVGMVCGENYPWWQLSLWELSMVEIVWVGIVRVGVVQVEVVLEQSITSCRILITTHREEYNILITSYIYKKIDWIGDFQVVVIQWKFSGWEVACVV